MEEVKLLQFADDMILYVESPEDSTKISKSKSIQEGFKVWNQHTKTVAFRDTENKQLEK